MAAFLNEYQRDRRETQTTEMLFERAGAFIRTRSPIPTDAETAGFKGIVFKGPFVDDSNWFALPASDFAVAMERRLLTRFDETLRRATTGRLGPGVDRDARTVARALDDAATQLHTQGYTPSLFVLTGSLGFSLYSGLVEFIIPDWDARVETALRTTHRIIGMHAGIPILEISESPEPGLYAVDLASFGSLTRYGDDSVPQIQEFTDDVAAEILRQQPRLILTPPPESGLDQERIQQLQLRVGLELWETYELRVTDPLAVVGRPLVGPILD